MLVGEASVQDALAEDWVEMVVVVVLGEAEMKGSMVALRTTKTSVGNGRRRSHSKENSNKTGSSPWMLNPNKGRLQKVQN